MVSKASDDLPEPDNPVTTVKRLRGNSTLTSLRLCCRAPRTVILSIAIESQTQIVKNLPESITLDCTRWVGGRSRQATASAACSTVFFISGVGLYRRGRRGRGEGKGV